jgi:toxoflavin synthase
MSTADQVKKDYDDHAAAYADYHVFPSGIIESELLTAAMGDCTGLKGLDLGGGNSHRAREAVEAGAAAVDVVDLSPEMLRIGEDLEKSLGRNCIRWLLADIAKPMDDFPLQEYDLVMANWVFDHAGSIEELEAMWINVVKYLKPGGRYFGVRVASPRSEAYREGKYGVRFKDHQDIPGGVKYRYEIMQDPPFDFEATSMEISYSGSTEMHEKFGLHDVKTVPYEEMECIKKNPEFWELFLKDPPLAVITAKKVE